MKIPTTVLATLLAALPATALAQQAPHQNYRPAPHVSQSMRTTTVHQTVYSRQTTTVQRNVSVGYTPRQIQPMPVYQARSVVSYYGYSAPVYPVWHWNGGVAWVGIPQFWGFGFWGNFAPAPPVATYTVAESSPGAQLLANYNLTQGPCDQDNMVQIYGPDNSEICAYPNNLVSPGQYQIDMSNLSLVSA
jgi:hypothetical protein